MGESAEPVLQCGGYILAASPWSDAFAPALAALLRSFLGAFQGAEERQDRFINVSRERRRTAVEPCVDRIRWHLFVYGLLVAVLAGMLTGLLFRHFRRIHNPEVVGSSPTLGTFHQGVSLVRSASGDPFQHDACPGGFHHVHTALNGAAASCGSKGIVCSPL